MVLLVCSIHASAQSDIKLSSFYLTPLTYNPAYAGSYEGMTFTSLYSSQWVGFDGAPKSVFLNGHGTFFGPKTGLGLELVHDEIGATTDSKFLGNYAYHIELNRTWNLSLGVKAGVSYYSVDYNKLRIQYPNEFNNFNGDLNNVNLNIGAGFFVHNEDFYFGVGIPNFLTTTYLDSYQATLANSTPNYYISSGYKFNIENNISFQPSILVRAVNGAPVNTLFAGTINWQEQFYGSLIVDLKSTIGGFAGFRISENYLIGYSYDSSITQFSNSNNGIHSFFLNFRLEDYWRRKRCGCYSF